MAEQGVIHSPTFTLSLPLIIRLLLARKTWKLWTSRRRKFPCYPVGGLIGGISKKHIFHLGLAVFNIFFGPFLSVLVLLKTLNQPNIQRHTGHRLLADPPFLSFSWWLMFSLAGKMLKATNPLSSNFLRASLAT